MEEICRILKTAIDEVPVPYFITDKNSKIIYFNKALLENTRYTYDEIIGKTPSIFKSGKHNKNFYKRLWDTINEGKHYTTRIINKRKDGTEYQCILSIQPIKINEEIKYFVAREEDISKLIEFESKLIETQKLESIALMIGELAHDFNNFLTVIIGSLELIKDEFKENTLYSTLINEIHKSAKNQANTIKQLLIFARKNEPSVKPVNINRLLEELKPLIQSQITANIKLTYNLSEDIKTVYIDEQQIKQALLNITSNAKDAIEGNGEIIIKTYNYFSNTELIEPYHEGEYVVIEVLDNGKGISKEAEKHMFEPFYTTKPKGKGTGLGLSSVYGIIKNHGGYIYGSNRKDTNGASFRIYLPTH
jgi:two-component system cell cycle sensor histidine kinase/response regulator CckA